MASEQIPNRVLLFDGVCNLCNGAVQFIIKRDPDGLISFTSLQSETGQSLLKKAGSRLISLTALSLLKTAKCTQSQLQPLRFSGICGAYGASSSCFSQCRSLSEIWSILSLQGTVISGLAKKMNVCSPPLLSKKIFTVNEKMASLHR